MMPSTIASNLLPKFVNYGHKKFYDICPPPPGFMVSAGITALLKKMDYKDVVVAIDGSVFRFQFHKTFLDVIYDPSGVTCSQCYKTFFDVITSLSE
jgi:hypothetical protein